MIGALSSSCLSFRRVRTLLALLLAVQICSCSNDPAGPLRGVTLTLTACMFGTQTALTHHVFHVSLL
jgi:hypothetical protein